MPVYNASFMLPIYPSTATPLLEIKAGATDYPVVTEIGLSTIQASAGSGVSLGIGIAGSQGTAFQSWPFLPEDSNNPACGVTLIGSWTTLPTVPANFFRRWSHDAVITSPFNFTLKFGSGIKLAPSTSLLIWIISGVGLNAQRYYIGQAWGVIDS